MRFDADPLYLIFEQHLFNALVEDDGTDAFLNAVVQDYIGRLIATGTVMPREVLPIIESDLKAEVLEMLRKKTYGHFNLKEFRKAKGVEAQGVISTTEMLSPNANARRARRAC